MAEGNSGNIRSIFVEWSLRDKVTKPADQINRRLDMTRDRAKEVKYSFWNTSSAMESLSGAGAFFGNMERDLRETATRQQYHNQLLGEAAVKYSRLKDRARDFAETTKATVQQASTAINEHRTAILGLGAALSGAGYVGYNFYAAGTRDLADYEDAYATFVKNVGADSDELIRRMQDASAGTISETQILLNANRAMIMDIPYDYLPRMMEVSRAAARGMGEDVDHMFESIVTGSARESPMILDNLGIKMNQLTEYEKKWAKARGLNAAALTAEQQRQVFLNYVMENSAGIIEKVDLSQESLNEQIARSEVAWKDFHQELTAGARPAIAGILDITEGATAALRDMPAPLKAVVGTAGLAGTAIAGIGGPLLINAVAVAYLVTNYDTLADVLTTASTRTIAHASALVTRLIPASVATAYAQGGLTAALWAGAAASWAFLAPWLPIIGAVGLAVGAVLLLQDVLVKGWDSSYLGQFVGWLLDTLPFLQPAADAVAAGFQWFHDAVVGAASGVGAFLDQFGPLKYLLLGPVGALVYLAQNFDRVTAAIRGLIDWVAGIPRAIGAAAAAVTENPIFKMLSGAASFAANPFGTALELITPKVKPEVIEPDMDPEYYTKGSIAFKVRTPEVQPDILPPEPSALDRLGSLLAGALTAPLLPGLAVPALALQALTPQVVPSIPEIPTIEAPGSPGRSLQGNSTISITVQNTIENITITDGDIQKQIRDALSLSTHDQVKIVERRLVDCLRACGI